MKLPNHIEGFITAQNTPDSNAFAAYFTDQATVTDEGSSYSGRDEIKDWIQQATDKYQMQLKPIDYDQTSSSAVLTVEVAGIFPGSPATMRYHIELDNALISSLRITG